MGDSSEPCRTPRPMVSEGEVIFPIRTCECIPEYQCLMRRHVFPDMPESFKWPRRTGYSTVSKAAARS